MPTTACHTFLLASGNCRLALTQSDLDDQEGCTYRPLQVHSCTSVPTDPLVAVFSAFVAVFCALLRGAPDLPTVAEAAACYFHASPANCRQSIGSLGLLGDRFNTLDLSLSLS